MKLKLLVTVVCVSVLLSVSVIRAENMCRAPVSTAEGPVVGTSDDNPDICAYKGIPYAAAPVGQLRWCSTQPAPARTEVLEAVNFGAECPQISAVPSILAGGEKPVRNEDCLFLNVWRPKKSGKFPVMVWIHGGGLTIGSGSEPLYRGDRLSAQRDIVVVSFNYRLHALGFLSHSELSEEDPNGSSGAYGLHDQIEALKWVKKNIAGFGGDPDNVTIFGESAGGYSVCVLMASPLAKGLFEKAIIQSGACEVDTTPEEAFATGDEFAARLGCPKDGALDCMRSKSADEITLAAGDRFKRGSRPIGFGPFKSPWKPHIDNYTFVENPVDALNAGRYNQVPLMAGSTRDEFKLFAALYKILYRRTRESSVTETIVESLGEELFAVFQKLYPYEKYDRAIDALCDAVGDVKLGCPTFHAAESSARYQPTYYYRFDYDDSRSPKLLGAAHTFEIPFIFDTIGEPYSQFLYSRRQEKRARPLIESMMSYWANFAKTGDPNGAGLMEWPKYDLDKRLRMYLDLPMRVEPADNVEKCAFWKTNLKNLK